MTDGRIVSWDHSYTGLRQPFSGHLNIHRTLQSDRQAKRDEINRPAESFCKAPFQFFRDHSCISPPVEMKVKQVLCCCASKIHLKNTAEVK